MEVISEDDTLEQYHLPQLKYADMVINESLRLFSPVPFIMRRTENDIHTGSKLIRTSFLKKRDDLYIFLLE